MRVNKPGFPLLLHDEPILSNGQIIGRSTSGNFSFNYQKNIAFGYIKSEIDLQNIEKKKLEIEFEKIKYDVSIEEKPLHDPENINIKM